MSGSEVAIVGGGVIGLSIAYALARRGVRSTVLDAGDPGRAASWAGAGILSPPPERPTTHPSAALRGLSAKLHAEWAESLREETGIDNGYRVSGGVDIAWTEAEARDLLSSAGRWRDEGIAFENLAEVDIRRVEPALNPEIRTAYFLPDRAQIRNPRHLRALADAIAKRGSNIRANSAAIGFDASGGRIDAVLTESDRIACDSVVIAAGPWSGRLLQGLGIAVKTPPIKGEIVLFRADRPIVSRIVEHGKDYLVPRDDGRILAGASEEDAGFDLRSTPEAIRRLIDVAIRLCPALKTVPIERTWAGLRPGSLDTRPYLGAAPGFENLFVASGHRRAGLQLSTGSAEVIADLILGDAPQFDLGPFRVGREPATVEEEEAFRS